MNSSISIFASILAIIAALSAITMGMIVWFGDRKNRSRISFLGVSIFVSVWIITNVFFSIGFGQYDYLVVLISYLSALLTVVQIFAFCLDLVRKKPTKGPLLGLIVVGYVAAFVSVIPGVVARGVVDGKIQTQSPAFGIYAVVLVSYIIASCVILLVKQRQASGATKQRIKFVLRGIVVAGIIGVFFNLFLPFLNVYEFTELGPAGAVALVTAVAYSIIKFSLFDIRLAIVRTIAYGISLLTLAVFYFVIIYVIFGSFFGRNMSALQAILSGILAFGLGSLFPAVKHFFDQVTNKVFYKDSYNAEDFIARLTKRLSVITSLDVLLRYSSSEISSTLKASFGAFYIHQVGKPVVFVATDKTKKLPAQDIEMLGKYVIDNHQQIIITDNLGPETSRDIKRMLDSYHIALVLPITKDSIIAGYLFLGDHLSSRYSTSDTQTLMTIADELSIALQNASAIQEIRALNESLQHRVDVATKELRSSNAMLRHLDKTKDDFISMASHQLRTPLTSIKGYISMVREGDVGKITKSQDQLLGEAFTSSERMVHLINDFLSVSRMQTGKFQIDKRLVNLAKVVDQELDSLATTAESRKLAFIYKAPKNFPILTLDEDKMRQVIMNFSDNAIYYSPEGAKIKVKLVANTKDVTFSITDTGIGVPRAEQSQLFSKFYRASNARKQRPDGTGVGLYLAKTVIEAHGGQVIFESVENRGSTFGFKLPIEQLRARGDADNLDNKNNKS
jgi:signal transduction histidine kinase